MRNPAVTWLIVGAIFEVLVLGSFGLLYVLDIVSGEDAKTWVLKLAVAVAILAGGGAVIGALLGSAKSTEGAPKP
jgi:hypothetical protein